MLDSLQTVLIEYSLITAFALIGGIVAVSYFLSAHLTRGRLHGSAIAIVIGLVLAYVGGTLVPEGERGLADLPIFVGVGLMGGIMLRDFAIVSTAMGVHLSELKRTGLGGVVSLAIGLTLPFVLGVIVGYAFGYRSAEDLTTLGAGAATFIVGPVTGTALNASSEVIALSVGTGVAKAILVMIATPFIARFIGLNNPHTAVIFGGLMGTTSGVAGGLAATDPKLVPYGAMSATFYTGLGCLLGPSVMYFLINQIF